MALNLLSLISASPSFSIKGSNGDLASQLKISRVSIKLTSTALRHTKEDGSSVVDSRIINPTSVSLDGICPDQSTLTATLTAASGNNLLYTITSRGVIVKNLMIEDHQLKQSADMTSGAPVRISFKELMTRSSAVKVMAQAADASLIDKGMSLLSNPAQTVSDLAAKIKGIL